MSLRDVSIDLTHPIIVQLAQGFDGHDRWYLEALGTACEGREETIWNLLKRKAHANPLRWTDAFAAITWRLHPDPAVAPLKQRAMAAGLTPAQRRQAIDALAFIPTRDAGKAVLAAALNGPEDLRSYAAWWVTSRSTNTWKAFGLVEQLPPDPEAIAAAKENKRMQAGRNKLKDAKQLTEELRQTAIDMAKSPFGASHLLMLAGRNELPDFIYPIVVQHIHDNADVSVRALASRFFPKPDVTGQALPPIGDIANLTGNLENGKSLYFGRAACATCHLHGSQGRDIGPNLTGIGQRFNRTAILDSIINPSAAITFGYEAVLIETVEGRAYSGFVIGEGDTLILKDIAGQQHSIPTSSIRSRTKLDQSIMPPGPSLALTAQDLADLVSYLTGAP